MDGVHGWMDGIQRWMDGRRDGWIHGCNEWMRWMDRRVNGWMDKWMGDGWMDTRIHVTLYHVVRCCCV